MTMDNNFDVLGGAHADAPLRRPRMNPRQRYDRTLLIDLIAVLQAHPKGLRRWSVMRAMRTRRERAGHDVTLKFEDEIERLFRDFCAAEPPIDGDVKPFFRPKETAGEVWSVDPARLAVFMAGEDAA
jgi:hypothetical protein